ncbi:hypothetical protein IMZ68_03830 [Candidatus Bathyarchaeota archaeon]|nr:hypothetical protein [Candidatus Bathyarchaeota archaeon]
MDAATTTYILIFLAVLVSVVVTVVLFALARRVRKEESLVGFTAKSMDEKYYGCFLLIAGIIIIFFSVYEVVALFTGGFSSEMPFNLSDISTGAGGQNSVVVSGQVLGLLAGVSFWLMMIIFGGRKIVALGLDMFKGRKVVLRRSLRKTQSNS